MPEPDCTLADHVHAVVAAAAPDLVPKTWYGMLAYARGSKVVCSFQSAATFGARDATLGFSDEANLGDGPVWPTSFAIAEWTLTVEAQVAEIVRRAAR